MKKLRLYLDTSVIGGHFDPEFAEPTRRLFAEFANGKFVPVVSDIVGIEVASAPPDVQQLLLNTKNFAWEQIAENSESIALARAYIDAGILSANWMDDCRHVAVATIHRVDMVISWNFRHIVHFDKIRAFNGVNLLKGYGTLEIRSPMEVIDHDK